ncbi:MAG: long-chain fatty acid--CoA ligase [Planctomycetales bacterium]
MTEVEGYSSLCAMHRAICERLGPRTAIRHKRHGRYRDLSWSEYRRQADGAAAGLLELGIRGGDRVAMLSENRREWLIADHAVLSTGGVTVPLHAPLSPTQVQYQISHSDARGIIVSGQEQADKVARVINDLPNLEFLISFDPIDSAVSLKTLTWDGLIHRGRRANDGVQDELREREASLSWQDPATIIYTSGTTGNPKGVVLSHGNLLTNAAATLRIADSHPGDALLSWLPYSHIYARTVDHYLTTLAEAVLCLGESVETLLVNLAETQPHGMTAVPRFYEKVWSKVESLPPDHRAAVLRKIFGPRLRNVTSGGAPLPKHVCEGFFEAGIPLLEGYGLTESSPVICFNRLDAYRVGSVGKAVPGVEVRIAGDGEILTKGPHVMQGYWKNDDATAATMTDGWLKTGDVGFLDDEGFLTITDRKKDLLITSGGKNISPSELERLLAGDVHIDQAVAYGDGRAFVVALLVPSFPHLEAKARELGVEIETTGEFITTGGLMEFYETRVQAVMEAVSQPERVKRILLLARPFQLEADELTATLKVRRRHIIEKYASQLSALYESSQPDEVS